MENTIQHFDFDGTRFEVITHPNTIEVTGYQEVIILGSQDEDDEDFEEDGEYWVFHEVFSGYTLSECLCKALMEVDRADDWQEAIAELAEIGVPYVSSED